METGLFDLIYKQNLPRAPAYLGMSLSIRGRRVFKNRSKRKGSGKENVDVKSDGKRETITLKPPSPIVQPYYTPTEISADMYEGPIIGDLMEEIQNSYLSYCENGIDFIPSSPQAAKLKKKMTVTAKPDRVSNKSEWGPTCRKFRNRKRSSANRKSKGSEKARKEPPLSVHQHQSSTSTSSQSANGVVARHQVFLKSKFYCDVEREGNVGGALWDHDAGVLKGKNILLKFSPSVNKNYVRNEHCLTASLLAPGRLRILSQNAKRNC